MVVRRGSTVYERGTICLLNVYERGTFSVKNVIEKGNGLDLGADLRVYPPPLVPGPVPCEQSLRLSLGSFKQQLRLREQQLKSEFALPQTLLGLFRLVKFVL